MRKRGERYLVMKRLSRDVYANVSVYSVFSGDTVII